MWYYYITDINYFVSIINLFRYRVLETLRGFFSRQRRFDKINSTLVRYIVPTFNRSTTTYVMYRFITLYKRVLIIR